VTIGLSLGGEDGNEIPNGATTITNLPALGYVARFIHVLFPKAALDDFTGSLIAESAEGGLPRRPWNRGPLPGLPVHAK